MRRMALPSGFSTSTDIMRRVKSKGISSSFLYFSINGLLVEVGAVEDRAVEQVLETGLEIADEVAVQKHFLALPPGRRRNAARGSTRSSVSVPVLSVHSTSMPPKF